MEGKNHIHSHKGNSFFIHHEKLFHFNGRLAILATQHGKEQAIAPVVWEGLGLKIAVSGKINTDRFGTFAGDIERPASQFETATLKALACLELHPEADLAVASEGAFYPHPEIPFLTLNTEIVLLCDRNSGFKIAGYHHSLETLAASEEVATAEQLFAFAKRMKFPEFGLILKVKTGENFALEKDFVNLESLETAFLALCKFNGSVTVETDLRAHRNPLRMKMIGEATRDLVHRLSARCPRCGCPDFVVKNFEKGLPCEQCQLPTRMPLKDIKSCNHCGFLEEIMFPKGKYAYAGHCDWCNP